MRLIRPATVFLDVGANVGLFSVLAARNGAAVVAVEARSSNAALLLENAQRNGVQIELHPVAASDSAGYAVLNYGENVNAEIRRRLRHPTRS